MSILVQSKNYSSWSSNCELALMLIPSLARLFQESNRNEAVTTSTPPTFNIQNIFSSVSRSYSPKEIKMFVDFKNEEEIKDYLKNLGIEYRFGCFSEKKPEVCHLLGEYLDAIKQDFTKASKIYKTNCDEYDYAKSCHNYAKYAFVGKGEDKGNLDVAYNYFTKACNLGISGSCLYAGLMDVSSSPHVKREKDYKKGLASLEKACELGNDYSCYYLSGMYISGSKEKVVKKDMKLAFKYSEKACELGNMDACLNLSIMYKNGDGVQKNEEMSEKMKKKAADMQEEINSNLTIHFGRGTK